MKSCIELIHGQEYKLNQLYPLFVLHFILFASLPEGGDSETLKK